MRLDKYLKVSRIIKRRTVANEACDAGRVSVNGMTAALGDKADPERDSILVDGAPLPSGGEKVYINAKQTQRLCDHHEG